ncbi:MAG: hypothetical protein PF961_23250 [Planctomycetota bacterium]|jgi:hypothetical protein|nr:hypothetical protein [Planctomycetota bacterium]
MKFLLPSLTAILGMVLGLGSCGTSQPQVLDDQAAAAPQEAPAPNAKVLLASLDQAYQEDPGSFAVLLAVPGPEIVVQSLRVDGITVLPEAERDPDQLYPPVPWQRSRHFQDEQGTWLLIDGKLKSLVQRAIPLEMVLSNGQALRTTLTKRDDRPRVTALVANADRTVVYACLQGGASATETGTLSAKPLGPPSWVSGNKIEPGGFQVARWDLKQALPHNTRVAIRLDTDASSQIAVSKVVSRFALGLEAGVTGHHGLEVEPFMRRGPDGVPGDGRQMMACPIHKHGSNMAEVCSKLLDLQINAEIEAPQLDTVVVVCRDRALTGYAWFGRITDALNINPNVPVPMGAAGTDDPVLHTSIVTRQAVRSVEPAPVHSLLTETIRGKRGTVEDVTVIRARAYAILAQGVKALLYRHWKSPLVDPIMRQLQSEIAVLQPYLAQAMAIPSGPGPSGALMIGHSELLAIHIDGQSIDLQLPTSWTLDAPEVLIGTGKAKKSTKKTASLHVSDATGRITVVLWRLRQPGSVD